MENVIYRDIVIETYAAINENSSSKIRARPVKGQGLDTGLKVECSKTMREKFPLGSKIKVRAKITNRQGTIFVYTRYDWDHRLMSNEEADEFIKEEF